MRSLLFLSFCLLFFLLLACENMVLGPAESDEPINVFELFWTEIDEHSGIIYPKNVNWDSVYQVYKSQVTPQTNEEELWNIFSQMIEVFDDEHTVIFDGKGKLYASGAHRIGDAIKSFSKDLVKNKYLENYEAFEVIYAPDFSFGKIKEKDIGYIYIGDSDGASPDRLMADVLRKIGQHKAIIFDVRNNGGGEGNFAIEVTDGFAQETRLAYTFQTRNGLEYNSYDHKTEVYNTSDGVNQFTKPVIVLTDAFSVSAAERIALALKVNTNVTHLGDTTAGAFSALSNRRFLPNGWSYQYPIEMSQSADGEFLDGGGLVPDIYVKNTPADIAAERDLVLEKAIELLD